MAITSNIVALERAADIVSSYVSYNRVQTSELPKLIGMVLDILNDLCPADPSTATTRQKPAVSPSLSVHDTFIICLEDGKRFKTLKRHLSSKYGMTADEYRAKWNLPGNYPMIAPAYANERSKLAKRLGLDRKAKAAARRATARRQSAAL
ncbi:MucR family transcriptional regulator [Camelimonas sp. ID_303_24]